jgi:hypothetical protein
LETGGAEGGSMEESLPVYTKSVLDGLLEAEEREARAAKLRMVATLNPKRAGFPEQQAKILEHYHGMANGTEFPPVKAIATELGVSDGTVKTHTSRTLRKLVAHFSATAETNANGKKAAIGYDTIAALPREVLTNERLSAKEVRFIKACFDVSDAGLDLSQASIATSMNATKPAFTLNLKEVGTLAAFDFGVPFTHAERRVIDECEKLRDDSKPSYRKLSHTLAKNVDTLKSIKRDIQEKVNTALYEPEDTSHMGKRKVTHVSDLRDISADALAKIKLSKREQALIDVVTSMPEGEVNTTSVAKAMGIGPYQTLTLKRQIERKASSIATGSQTTL